ncbi:hypothetical protein [Caldiplasma sukawensis]
MRSINARRRSDRSFREGIGVSKTIVADTVTRGGYSKSIAAFHFAKGLKYRAEARKERKNARREARILRKYSKERRK